MPARLVNRICRSEDDSDERRHFIIICSLDHSPPVDKPKRRIEQPKTYSSHSGGSADKKNKHRNQKEKLSFNYVPILFSLDTVAAAAAAAVKNRLNERQIKIYEKRNDKINKEKRRAGTAKEKYVCKFLHHFRALIRCILEVSYMTATTPHSTRLLLCIICCMHESLLPLATHSTHVRSAGGTKPCFSI